MMAKILLIDDEECIRFTFKFFLEDDGHEVVLASDYDEAVGKLSEREFDLILTEDVLIGHTGIELLKKVRKMNPPCPVVIITGRLDSRRASDALKEGAFDYLFKPVQKDKLLHTAKMALNTAFRK